MKKEPILQAAENLPKSIIFFVKVLHYISPILTLKLLILFLTKPIKFKTPEREKDFIGKVKQTKVHVPSLNKSIQLYRLKNNGPKILLVHGWSGRGSQLFAIAKKCYEQGYDVTTFDAPAHGKSDSRNTLLLEFVRCIEYLSKKLGPYNYAVGHSFGAISVLNAIRLSTSFEKVVVISMQEDIIESFRQFINVFKLPQDYVERISQFYYDKYMLKVASFSPINFVKKINTPTLVVHCKSDTDVPVNAAKLVQKQLPNSKLFLTRECGHRRILRDETVINEIISFLSTK